jgi:hypothetical protein
VFVTSIGTDDIFFPLNLFWGVLFWYERTQPPPPRASFVFPFFL